jgi:hypothetical protein
MPELAALIKKNVSGAVDSAVGAVDSTARLNTQMIQKEADRQAREADAMGRKTGAIGQATGEKRRILMGSVEQLAKANVDATQARQAAKEGAINQSSGLLTTAAGIGQRGAEDYQGVLNLAKQMGVNATAEGASRIIEAAQLAANAGLSLEQAAAQLELSGTEKAILQQHQTTQEVAGQKINLGHNLGSLTMQGTTAAEGMTIAPVTNAAQIKTAAAENKATDIGAVIGTTLKSIFGRAPSTAEATEFEAMVAEEKAKAKKTSSNGSAYQAWLDTQLHRTNI